MALFPTTLADHQGHFINFKCNFSCTCAAFDHHCRRRWDSYTDCVIINGRTAELTYFQLTWSLRKNCLLKQTGCIQQFTHSQTLYRNTAEQGGFVFTCGVRARVSESGCIIGVFGEVLIRSEQSQLESRRAKARKGLSGAALAMGERQ